MHSQKHLKYNIFHSNTTLYALIKSSQIRHIMHNFSPICSPQIPLVVREFPLRAPCEFPLRVREIPLRRTPKYSMIISLSGSSPQRAPKGVLTRNALLEHDKKHPKIRPKTTSINTIFDKLGGQKMVRKWAQKMVEKRIHKFDKKSIKMGVQKWVKK